LSWLAAAAVGRGRQFARGRLLMAVFNLAQELEQAAPIKAQRIDSRQKARVSC